MGFHLVRLAACLGAIGLATAALPAGAGEIKVFSAEAPRDALEHVAAQFEKTTGHKITFEFMTAGQVRGKIDAGENADLAVASSGVIAEMVKSGKAGDATNLGRIGLAMAVRDDAPEPGVDTPEDLDRVRKAFHRMSKAETGRPGKIDQVRKAR